MARDLRVKAVVRAPPVDTGSEGSDEEWVNSSDETSSRASNHSSQSKQRRSSHPATPSCGLLEDEGGQGPVAVAPAFQKTQFESWEELHE
jgi:hypothetical protein